MKGRLTITTVAGSWWAIQSASNGVGYQGVRQFVMKASDRAAVHGVRPPLEDIVDVSFFFFFLFFCSSFSKWILRWVFVSFLLQKEALEVESQKAKEEREKKRKEIEDIVDSQLKKTSLNVLSNH